MARISEYTDGGTPLATDEFVVARVGTTRKLTFSAIETAVGGSLRAGHLWGLTLSNNAGDATNDIDIAAGEARDSTNAEDIVLASALTKRLDAAWAVGTNQGGLDTGAIANTTYHVWLIKRSDTDVVDVLFSASASSPTMPAAYDYKRRIGSIVRAGGAILLFTQRADQFWLKAPVRDVNTQTIGGASSTFTLASVPTGIIVEAIIAGYCYKVGVASSAYIRALTDTDSAVGYATFQNLIDASAGNGAVSMMRIFTNTSGQLAARAAAATTVLDIVTYGWVDTRDRLA